MEETKFKDMQRITGAQVKGENHSRAREDYYSTNPNSVKKLLEREKFEGQGCEPAVGDGAIAKFFPESMIRFDIREDADIYGEKGINFFMWNAEKPLDYIITNPPFKTFKEFALHGLKQLRWGGKMALFGRIQILEGKARYKELWSKHPPTRIYQFVSRQQCFYEGEERTGSIMAFAWFVWEKGNTKKPTIEWIE